MPEPLAEWTYQPAEWNVFVKQELKNKKEDNFYFGCGILVMGTVGLLLLRNATFLLAIGISAVLAFLIPFLRQKFSYPHLKASKKPVVVQFYYDVLRVDEKIIKLRIDKLKGRHVRNVTIVPQKNGTQFIEIVVEWMTGKGPTNDEFRFLIPEGKMDEALALVKTYGF